MTQTSKSKPEPLLWLSDARGVYIPRDFAKSFADRDKSVSGVSAEQWAILEASDSADNESYWDTWQEVCDHATVTDEHGRKFTVYQEGDCWLIPEGMEWNDKEGFFSWPAPEPTDAEFDAILAEILDEMTGREILECSAGAKESLTCRFESEVKERFADGETAGDETQVLRDRVQRLLATVKAKAPDGAASLLEHWHNGHAYYDFNNATIAIFCDALERQIEEQKTSQ